MKSICVFCGSSAGHNDVFQKATVELGNAIAEKQVRLIYGGGSVGLMGILADTVLDKGGKVIGVIPKFLYDKEVGHDGLSELIIVDSMHERKQKMAEISDGFVAIPGGIGTMDELFEIFTWSQLGLVSCPVALLNINYYFDPVIAFLDQMVHNGFLRKETNDQLIKAGSVRELFSRMSDFSMMLTEQKIDKT